MHILPSDMSPTNWMLNGVEKMIDPKNQAFKREALSRITTLFLGCPFGVLSSAYNAAACLIKAPVTLFTVTIGQHPTIKQKIGDKLVDFSYTELGWHIYKVAAYVISALLCPILGLSPKLNIDLHEKWYLKTKWEKTGKPDGEQPKPGDGPETYTPKPGPGRPKRDFGVSSDTEEGAGKEAPKPDPSLTSSQTNLFDRKEDLDFLAQLGGGKEEEPEKEESKSETSSPDGTLTSDNEISDKPLTSDSDSVSPPPPPPSGSTPPPPPPPSSAHSSGTKKKWEVKDSGAPVDKGIAIKLTAQQKAKIEQEQEKGGVISGLLSYFSRANAVKVEEAESSSEEELEIEEEEEVEEVEVEEVEEEESEESSSDNEGKPKPASKNVPKQTIRTAWKGTLDKMAANMIFPEEESVNANPDRDPSEWEVDDTKPKPKANRKSQQISPRKSVAPASTPASAPTPAPASSRASVAIRPSAPTPAPASSRASVAIRPSAPTPAPAPAPASLRASVAIPAVAPGSQPQPGTAPGAAPRPGSTRIVDEAANKSVQEKRALFGGTK